MTDYYVSITGSDTNSGLTPSNPWRHLQYATNKLYAGDTLNIKPGSYQERIVGVNSGTDGNHITFKNYGDKPVIDGSWMTSKTEGLLQFGSQQHICISGLKVANSSAYGFSFPMATNDIIIQNCEIYGHSLSGIYFYPGYGDVNPVLTTNILIEDNIIYDCQNWWNHQTNGPNEGVTISNVDGFIFRNNYLYNNHKLPVDMKNNVRNGQVYGNIMDTSHTLNNGGGGFYVDAYDDHARDIDIYSNIVYGTDTGFTFGTEQGGTLERIRMYNNVYYGTGSAFQINNMWHTKESNCSNAMCTGDVSNCCEIPGITQGVSPHLKTDCSIINNTVYNANWGLRLNDRPESFLNQNFIVRNNIFYSTNGITKGSGNVDFSKILIDHNLFKPGANSDTRGTNYFENDPKFVSAANHDFNLQQTSPCINAGNNQNAPDKDFSFHPRNLITDIGAFEYMAHDDAVSFTVNVV